MLKKSQTALALFQGENASRLERVKILHPEWNDDQWDDEVSAIEAEFQEAVTDPMALPPEKPGSTIPSPDATQG
jgi:hypothetical protein